ncbi:hypothetical protein HMPREF0080_01782 [Anaeroglobus geminatus F0357]|uniref:Uncharacterized protein n=1 Tax=Anaeroglobus geminatus F0357 TaxID=861450 RepID=G9YJD2_9FIRM|nr:hypothetical protein HMPREF0080_01782 [Anaeroglobus geminatus F0357]
MNIIYILYYTPYQAIFLCLLTYLSIVHSGTTFTEARFRKAARFSSRKAHVAGLINFNHSLRICPFLTAKTSRSFTGLFTQIYTKRRHASHDVCLLQYT